MGFFLVRKNSSLLIYDRRLFIRLEATNLKYVKKPQGIFHIRHSIRSRSLHERRGMPHVVFLRRSDDRSAAATTTTSNDSSKNNTGAYSKAWKGLSLIVLKHVSQVSLTAPNRDFRSRFKSRPKRCNGQY